jgi:hypothetical protein
MRAIAWGIQAPNPHNTQAWKFRLVSDTEALLYLDERRLLPLLTDAEADEIRSRVAPGPIEVLTFNEPDAMRPLLDVFYRALEIEVTTRRLYEETRIWFRFNERQRRTHRDGLSMPQAGVDGLKRRLIEWTLRDGDPARWFGRRTINSTLKTLRQGIHSARGIVLVKTPTNRQVDWLEAGRRSPASTSASPSSVSRATTTTRCCRNSPRWPSSNASSTSWSQPGSRRRSRSPSGSAEPSRPTSPRAAIPATSSSTAQPPRPERRTGADGGLP